MAHKVHSLFKDASILITGGTGSLGRKLVERFISDFSLEPHRLVVFSRDEAKQYQMKKSLKDKVRRGLLEFKIGDIRNSDSVLDALRGVDIVINAAALKQVPSCEYYPMEAVQTNIVGASNIVNAIANHNPAVEIVVGLSTDKACKPVNTMGMTKAVQERIFIEGNLKAPQTKFICTRYGNVISSRGSVVPLFQEQVEAGKPFTITSMDMTRFLMSLDNAVDTIFDAIVEAKRGETFVPKVRSAKVVDIAKAVAMGHKSWNGHHLVELVGIRPGEKVHEVLVSEEECGRTEISGAYYVIKPALPELREDLKWGLLKEVSSEDCLMKLEEIRSMLRWT